MQEVRNAVDQAAREIANRYDFKGTNSTIELADDAIKLATASEDRLIALRQVLEEKLVKRQVSLKSIDYGKVEEASGRHRPPAGGHRRRHLVGQGPRAQQVHQGPRPQGHPVADPGRAAPGHRQEARRPPGRDHRPQGGRPRDPAAVQQLPGLTGGGAVRYAGWMTTSWWAAGTRPGRSRTASMPAVSTTTRVVLDALVAPHVVGGDDRHVRPPLAAGRPGLGRGRSPVASRTVDAGGADAEQLDRVDAVARRRGR